MAVGDVLELAGSRVTKKITRIGGGTMPPTGSTVRVHYTGKLVDGTVFDTSRKRGTPIAFALGQGQVIAGWDRGVASMSVGEQAILTIAPEFGYGNSATGPIPADSTLVFEVELVDWKAASVWKPLITRFLVCLAAVVFALFNISQFRVTERVGAFD
ncbi:hypothetical protein T492DRAFT_893279 [Pavlovales sp. CCMP2436]|nr:hypothetical protein T492DRAFT_893279 [Pavlovales sp. CCMP2436]